MTCNAEDVKGKEDLKNLIKEKSFQKKLSKSVSFSILINKIGFFLDYINK